MTHSRCSQLSEVSTVTATCHIVLAASRAGEDLTLAALIAAPAADVNEVLLRLLLRLLLRWLLRRLPRRLLRLLLALLLPLALLALLAAEPAPTLLLFFDKSRFTSFNDTLALRVNQPAKGPRVLQPDKPWESWAVFAYNHVVEFSPPPSAEYRMYYDCIEGDGVPPGSGRRLLLPGAPPLSALSHRRICLATSADGLVWTKPNLGIFVRNGSTANNILLEDSGVTVFRDENPAAPSSQRWKMTCSRAAYASPDGLRWVKLPSESAL